MSRSAVSCRVDRQLGQGSFGTVYSLQCSAPHLPPAKFALKLIKQDGRGRRSRGGDNVDDDGGGVDLKEMEMMSKLRHPHIIQLLDYFSTPMDAGGHSAPFLCVLMDLCEEGDLAQYIQTFSQNPHRDKSKGVEEDMVIKWTVQLTDALKYLHGKKIIHRDLKPCNIFMKDKTCLRIGDLGIAREIQTGQHAMTFVGTPIYMSPEIFQGHRYSYATDVWSLGCCVYELMALRSAFSRSNILFNLSHDIINKKVDPPVSYSGHLRAMVTSMLSKDPGDRPTAQALLQMLHRHWPGEKLDPGHDWKADRAHQGTSYSREWRHLAAKAVFTFRAQEADKLYAQVSAALARREITDHSDHIDRSHQQASLTADSERSGGGSSFSVGSHTERSHQQAFLREMLRQRSSFATGDSERSGEYYSSSLSEHSGYQTSITSDSELVNERSSHQASLIERSEDREDCDETEDSMTVVPATHLKIGKSSMVMRARPLPVPRPHRGQRENRQQMDNPEQYKSFSSGVVHPSTAASQKSDAVVLLENDSGFGGRGDNGGGGDSEDKATHTDSTVMGHTSRSEDSSSSSRSSGVSSSGERARTEWKKKTWSSHTVSGQTSRSGRGSGSELGAADRHADMAYASEVVQWARARLLTSPSPTVHPKSLSSSERVGMEGSDNGDNTTFISSEGTEDNGHPTDTILSGSREAGTGRDIARMRKHVTDDSRDSDTVLSAVGRGAARKKGVRNRAAMKREERDSETLESGGAAMSTSISTTSTTASTAAENMAPRETGARNWEMETKESSHIHSTAVSQRPRGTHGTVDPPLMQENKAPGMQGNLKKKKNKFFLRGKQTGPSGDGREGKGHREEGVRTSGEDSKVVLFTRGQCVTFTNNADMIESFT